MSSNSVTIIKPDSGWQVIDFKELKEYRDLFYFLVWRDIKVLYAQTILGFSWAILQPLIQIVIFTVIFGKVAKVSYGWYPLFSVFKCCNYPLDIYVPVHDAIESKPCQRTAYAGQGVFPKVDIPTNLRFIQSGEFRDLYADYYWL